jgi:hypothetical protein
MNLTWHPHRLVAVAIAAVVALAPACGDDDGRSSDAADAPPSPEPVSSPETGSGPGDCAVDEATIEDLFDIAVSRNPEVAPGMQTCGFGIDGQPGFAVNVNLLGDDVPPYGSYDAAVEQMSTEPASTDGTGLVPVNAGDEAVARVSAGHAELLARHGDQALLITALLPSAHRLAQADNDLLATTTELARLAL